MQSHLAGVVCLFYFEMWGHLGVLELVKLWRFYFDKRFELISCRRWINWRVVEKLCCIVTFAKVIFRRGEVLFGSLGLLREKTEW